MPPCQPQGASKVAGPVLPRTSLILGMAGLHIGYRAATHWVLYETLEALGVKAAHERVVADRNRFTGGGVTRGSTSA